MALTLNAAIQEIRNTLNEPTAVFWTDTEITDWIKEGTRIFSSKTLLNESVQVIDPLVANQIIYTSADETWIATLLEPYAALYLDGSDGYKGLIKIHPRQIGNVSLTTAGPTKYYCMFGQNIYIFPRPSATEAGTATLSMLVALETDDITDISDEWQHLSILYAIAKCKQKDQKFAEAGAFLDQFYQEIQFERQDKHAREVDSIDSFRIPKLSRSNRNVAG